MTTLLWHFFGTYAGVGDHDGLDLVGELVHKDGDAAVLVDAQRHLLGLFPLNKQSCKFLTIFSCLYVEFS